MPSSEILFAFFMTTAIFAYIPGPAMLYAIARTLSGGHRAGLMAALGIHVGCYVHVIAAALGLSALFHAVPIAYAAVKVAGAIYLVWLGISLFRAKTEESAEVNVSGAAAGRSAFLESILVEVLNPKTALFFLAFLPQFVDAAASFPLWLQMILLGTVVNLMFSSADVVCVILAGRLASGLRRSGRAQRMVRRAGGTILVGLGLHLAMQKS